jgi:excisionase family DNA binding protein
MPEPRNQGLTTGAVLSTKPALDPKLTLRVDEAATLLGISRGLAYELVNRGQLPALRLGRRIVVPRAMLEAFVAGGADAVPGPEPRMNDRAANATSTRSRSSKRRRSQSRSRDEGAGRLPLDVFDGRGD